MLEFIVLGVLTNKSLTGYDIRKYIEQGIGLFYKASFGSIYPILNTLNKKGLIDYSEELHGKRQSKMYNVTEKGKQEFNNWLEGKNCNSVEEFMAVVYFLDRLPKEQAASKIKSYSTQIDEYLNTLVAKKLHYEQSIDDTDYYYMMSTLKYGIYTLKNLKKWCEYLSNQKSLDDLIK